LLKDMSNGYDAVCDEFIAVRSNAGRDIVDKWATTLLDSASVLDIGAGSGIPLTAVLRDKGLNVHAIDASPNMVHAFQNQFPEIQIACEAVETSPFFHQKFDAIMAIGLVFLLSESNQRTLLPKIAKALKKGGKLLFSAPRQICTWEDILTHQTSQSLGVDEYVRLLRDSGLQIISQYQDKGGTHYYEAERIV